MIHASVDDPTIRSRSPVSTVTMLAAEPTRLVEEANTIPLFGGRRAVWVKAGSRNFAPAVEALIAAARRVAGGDRGRRPKRTAPLRAT